MSEWIYLWWELQIRKKCSKLYNVVNKAKRESQNGCFKKTKHAKFSKKETFLKP